ncbi:hypothetical protein HY480_03615 [Candidatus Uhrbacteria bacterium]|nr:hypothetical protein [Candidatus Uhrbacteria bacterium]
MRQRVGFVVPSTLIMVALLAVGTISIATTSRALEATVATDAATSAATEVTTPPLPPLPPAEPAPVAPTPAAMPVVVPEQTPSAAPATTTPEIMPIDDDRPEPPPNPQECRDVRRQIRDQFRELNRFEKMLRKLKLDADLQKLFEIRGKLKGFDIAVAQGCTRERLQDFYDEQAWEQINEFRCKADLPQQFVQIERELKRLERSTTVKKLDAARLDATRLKANIEEMRQALVAAKSGIAAGSCDDANDAMQTIYEGKHPGEMNGVIQRLYELGRQLIRVKDAAVREEFAAVLQPVIDAANEGDFREANQALNDIFNDLQRLLMRVISSSRYQYTPQLEKLEGILMEKLEGDRNAAPSAAPKQ